MFGKNFLMLKAGGQRLAFLQTFLHLRGQTFHAHGNKLNGRPKKRKEVGSVFSKIIVLVVIVPGAEAADLAFPR